METCDINIFHPVALSITGSILLSQVINPALQQDFQLLLLLLHLHGCLKLLDIWGREGGKQNKQLLLECHCYCRNKDGVR